MSFRITVMRLDGQKSTQGLALTATDNAKTVGISNKVSDGGITVSPIDVEYMQIDAGQRRTLLLNENFS